MTQTNQEQDFTVPVSMKEKALTSLLFIFGMGGVVYFARHFALSTNDNPHLYFNLSFAIAVFGVIRMVRAIFQQQRRGLLADQEGLKVATLFSQPDLPFSELGQTKFKFTDKPTSEVSFNWGQFAYRLPTNNNEKLAQLLVSKSIPIVFGEGDTLKFKHEATGIPLAKKAPRYRPQRPPGQVLMALIFWAVGTVAMFYTARL